MSDAREVQQLLARLKDAVHSNNKRHIAVDASDTEMAHDLRKSPPSGYTPLFPPAEVLERAQNVRRRICCLLFVICYFISSLTRATRRKNLPSKCTGLQLTALELPNRTGNRSDQMQEFFGTLMVDPIAGFLMAQEHQPKKNYRIPTSIYSRGNRHWWKGRTR